MKKRVTKPTDLLHQELDFSKLGPVRRNAFAGAGERGGPSLLALWEMPQIRPDTVMLRRGRPSKGEVRKTVAKSIRLPEAIWKEVEERALAKHLNLHQAMRSALLNWLKQAG